MFRSVIYFNIFIERHTFITPSRPSCPLTPSNLKRFVKKSQMMLGEIFLCHRNLHSNGKPPKARERDRTRDCKVELWNIFSPLDRLPKCVKKHKINKYYQQTIKYFMTKRDLLQHLRCIYILFILAPHFHTNAGVICKRLTSEGLLIDS